MAIFEDITLTWHGKEGVIRGDGPIMRMIAQMESEVRLGQLARGEYGYAQLAKAYRHALKAAGIHVSEAEVYASLFSDDMIGAQGVAQVVAQLMAMMTPPETLRKHLPKKETATRTEPRAETRTPNS